MYRVIDICCCDGGISEGFNRSKLFSKIVGVDIEPHPDYPFEFIQKDFQDLDPEWIRRNFDLVHISPPCQLHSWAVAKDKDRHEKYINLIPQARELVNKVGLPAIIENVTQAPIRNDLTLCGVMFGLNVVRHRRFELHKFFAVQPPHIRHAKPYMDVFNQYKSKYMQIAGHGGSSPSYKIEDWQKAMDISHIKLKENLVEAIPPAYSQYIAMQFDEFIKYHSTLDMFRQ